VGCSPYEKRQIRSSLNDMTFQFYRDIDTVILYPAPLDVIDFYSFLLSIRLRASLCVSARGERKRSAVSRFPREFPFSFFFFFFSSLR